MTDFIQPSGIIGSAVLPLRSARNGRQAEVILGWPGIDPAKPSLDIIVFDDSGSISSPFGNDPVGNRYKEAKRAIELVAQWSASSRSKVTILHFDHPMGASGVLPLNNRLLRVRLMPSLKPGGAGTSDLMPSLEAAERLAELYPDHDIRLTVFSDFLLTDQQPHEALKRFGEFPGAVHAVVFGSVGLELLEQTTGISITPISPNDPPGTFAAAIHQSLTTSRPGARRCRRRPGRSSP